MAIATGTALLGAGLLGAGASIAGGAIQGGAAGSAAEKQAQAQREAMAAQAAMQEKSLAAYQKYQDQARADLQPFRDAQLSALGQLQQLSDPNSSLAQAQRDQGTQAIQRQLAAQGLLRSGKQTSGLQQLELGLAQQRANTLQGLAGLGAAQGQSAIAANTGAGLAGLYQQQGNQLGSSFQNLGNINANRTLGVAGSTIGGLQGLSNAIQGGIQNYLVAQGQQDNANALNRLYESYIIRNAAPGGALGGFGNAAAFGGLA